MAKKIVIGLIVIATFLLAEQVNGLKGILGSWELQPRVASITARVLCYVFLPLLVLLFLHGVRKFWQEAGLAKSAVLGFGIAFLGTLPMLLGAAWVADFHWQIEPWAILSGCVMAAVGEEILYRGFLFGQLFRHVGLGFLPAGLVGALVFGAGHLYQSADPATAAGIFLVTAVGAIWFSWLYVEWDYNLWVPMGFHFWMNLSWEVFPVSDNALGSFAPNIFRFLTIGLSVFLTLRYRRQQGKPTILKGRAIWLGMEGRQQNTVNNIKSGSGLPKTLLLLLLLAGSSSLLAQQRVFSGFVMDSEQGELAYVNIGLVGTSLGTVSAPDGSFRLYVPDTLPENRLVRFSMIGYAARDLPLSQLATKEDKPAAIVLQEQALSLAEVTVRPQFVKRRTIGVDRTKVNRFNNFAISKEPNQNLGAEIGRIFRMPGRRALLEKFSFYVRYNNFDTIRFRVNVYALEQGKPGKSLLRENIILELVNGQKGWQELDLAHYQVLASNDIVVAVEWIYSGGKGGGLALPIAIPADGTHFYKYGSQGSWKKFPLMSTSMLLEVSYE